MAAPRQNTNAHQPAAFPPEAMLGEETMRRIEASCPGNTYMPPQCPGDPLGVVEQWVGEAEILGRTDNYLGKRRFPRFTWDAIVLLRVQTGRLAGKVIRARTKNISMGGMGIHLRSNLESGVKLEVMVEGRPFGIKATVVHCTRMMNGNLLGLYFDYAYGG